jgi:hypothetical protein
MLAATSLAAAANQCRTARGLRSTPKPDADLPAPTEIEVIDPAHPLYGRRFRLVSIARGTCSESCARVEWRFGLTLLLPLTVTNLGSRNEQRPTCTKLSIEALGELVAVAEASEGAWRSSLATSGVICRRPSAGKSSKISPRSCGR